MRAFVCVYRHSIPTARALAGTDAAAKADPLLRKFLKQYGADDSFLDWGDDPSFFAASEVLHTANAASWGVCRRDVRTQLCPGHFVIWFCAKEDSRHRDVWRYFYVGCGTVKHVISRWQLWEIGEFAPYTNFYNVLAKPVSRKLVQHETFLEYHRDWENRASAGYVIFDKSAKVTKINVCDPILVAEKRANSILEHWFSGENPRVRDIETALFKDLGIERRLRTRNRQRPHRHIALHRAPGLSARNRESALLRLRSTLLALA